MPVPLGRLFWSRWTSARITAPSCAKSVVSTGAASTLRHLTCLSEQVLEVLPADIKRELRNESTFERPFQIVEVQTNVQYVELATASTAAAGCSAIPTVATTSSSAIVSSCRGTGESGFGFAILECGSG